MTDDGWNYFIKDRPYAEVLRKRLVDGVEMDSACALASAMEKHFHGSLRIVDFGSGPGHYYPVIRKYYSKGDVRYLGVDIDPELVKFGNEYFRDDPSCRFEEGSVMEPGRHLPEANCVISANTLPHVPSVRPLLECLAPPGPARFFAFRMLIGVECVQIKKHLSQNTFDDMFATGYQFNNIYSPEYLRHYLGSSWGIHFLEDVFDHARLEQHSIPAEKGDSFYSNRVSRSVGSRVFKGEVYMPWKIVLGIRG